MLTTIQSDPIVLKPVDSQVGILDDTMSNIENHILPN